MNKLENFIRGHSEKFNDEEPTEGHFDRFEQRLDQQDVSSRERRPVRLWMKIAAGIIILATAGLAVFELSTYNFSGQSSLQQVTLGLPDELVEIITIYQQRSTQQVIELNQLAQLCPDKSSMINQTEKEVAKFDKNQDKLVNALQANPSNSRIQAALIQNCKAKESLLNDALLKGKIKECAGE
ncbi:MAG: hypothetical protein ISR57_04645 [Bacteroidales bacterium]|nr:hypothetical protein [Bacteroidota bacterium]MBL6949916.1 hypothetical protein [Bacteroidales bacterium]